MHPELTGSNDGMDESFVDELDDDDDETPESGRKQKSSTAKNSSSLSVREATLAERELAARAKSNFLNEREALVAERETAARQRESRITRVMLIFAIIFLLAAAAALVLYFMGLGPFKTTKDKEVLVLTTAPSSILPTAKTLSPTEVLEETASPTVASKEYKSEVTYSVIVPMGKELNVTTDLLTANLTALMDLLAPEVWSEVTSSMDSATLFNLTTSVDSLTKIACSEKIPPKSICADVVATVEVTTDGSNQTFKAFETELNSAIGEGRLHGFLREIGSDLEIVTFNGGITDNIAFDFPPTASPSAKTSGNGNKKPTTAPNDNIFNQTDSPKGTKVPGGRPTMAPIANKTNVPRPRPTAPPSGNAQEKPTRVPKRTPAPVNTTLAPGNATVAPGKATKAPGKATKVPGNATMPPGDATMQPGNATKSPGKATRAPGKATKVPGHATMPPGDASIQPGNATKAPGKATKAPGKATKVPGNATKAPGNASLEPGNATMAPGNKTKAPGNKTKVPGNTTKVPRNATKAT